MIVSSGKERPVKRKTILAAAVAATFAAVSAPAGAEIVGDVWVGDGTPALERPIFAYDADRNYCPGDLRPVVGGNGIRCGTPTAAGYGDRPMAGHHRGVGGHGRLMEGAKGVVYD